MRVTINKDFLTEYKDDFWKGFSASETLAIVGGMSTGVFISVLLHITIGIPVSALAYLVPFIAAPFIFAEFFQYQECLKPIRLLNEMPNLDEATSNGIRE